MVQINFATKEVSCKIVYYGPGLSGKTTNLQMVHDKVPAERKGKMTSIATEGERTLFFDFLPLDLGTVAGMNTKFQLYTVPGQVYYNATRRLVLKGVDGLVFVADSQPDKMAENLESWQNLKDNLNEHGLALDDIPVVFQWNKRDVADAVPIILMADRLNDIDAPAYEAVACEGEGVIATLRGVAGLVLERLNEQRRPAAASLASSEQAVGASADSRPAAAIPAAVTTSPAPPADPVIRPAAERETVATASAATTAVPVWPAARRRRATAGGRGPVVGPTAAPEPSEADDAPPRRPPRPVPVKRAAARARPTVTPSARLDESIGSAAGAGRGRPRRRGKVWIGVAAGLAAACAAGAAAYFAWFGG